MLRRASSFALALCLAAAVVDAKVVRERDDLKVEGLPAKVSIGGRSPVSRGFSPEVKSAFELESNQEVYSLNLRRSKGVRPGRPLSFDQSEIKAIDGNESDIFKVDGDTLKWDVEYKVDPRGGVGGDYIESWELEATPGVSFHYQPPLTQEEIDRGSVRPDNVIGSYAVYSDKSGHFKTSSGRTLVNYGTGKLAHIYRPLILDAEGNSVWGVLNITGGAMSIMIPATFLDNAVFPVTLDPDFGYTSVGASNTTWGQQVRVIFSTPTIAGTAVSMSLYHSQNNAASDSTLSLYNLSATTPWALLTDGRTVVLSGVLPVGWHVYKFTNYPTITPNALGYALSALSDGSGTHTIYYDTLDGASGGIAVDSDFVVNDPLQALNQGGDTLRYSMYVTYRTGGGWSKSRPVFMRGFR